jgi:ribosome-interacting GTPase 1
MDHSPPSYTYHFKSTLKAKIAKLKSELINGPGGKSAGSKDAGRGFEVSKSGDTRIGLVGTLVFCCFLYFV